MIWILCGGGHGRIQWLKLIGLIYELIEYFFFCDSVGIFFSIESVFKDRHNSPVVYYKFTLQPLFILIFKTKTDVELQLLIFIIFL